MKNSQPAANGIGQPCLIQRGPLTGLTGTITQRDGDGRVSIQLDGFCGVLVSVPPILIEPLG